MFTYNMNQSKLTNSYHSSLKSIIANIHSINY